MKTEELEKPFPIIVNVRREDLTEIFTSEQVARFDDDDMRRIAKQMGSAYCEQLFHIYLEIIAEIVLEEKDKQ